MKVLILHPDFNDPGGVAHYYRKMKGKFNISVQHYIIGKRPQEKGFFFKIIRMAQDYKVFLKTLKEDKYDLIHVNPSLDFNSLLRDGIFLVLARLMRKKTIVFIRGWHKAFEVKLKRRGLWIFKMFYGKINAFIVLSVEFKKKLKAWGFKQPIYLEVTITDDNALERFDIHQTLNERLKSKKWRVLFISRIIKSKGVYETIQAVSMLHGKYPDIELMIAGEGDELEKVKIFARDLILPNVLFTGYIRGEKKKKILNDAHILCFPSYHGEGLPNAMIESMAFGLPVVTRLVGGIADFFKNDEHGFVTTSTDPKEIAGFIERLLTDENLYKRISLFNYNYAKANFSASQAAIRLENIYKSVQ
jgi:glycosyltransferase involved in cell wall biosynthesis